MYRRFGPAFFCIRRDIYRFVPIPIGFVLFHIVCHIFQEPSVCRFQIVSIRPSSRILLPPAAGTTAIMYAECSVAKSPLITTERSDSSYATNRKYWKYSSHHARYSSFPYTVVSFGDIDTISSAAKETTPSRSQALAALM